MLDQLENRLFMNGKSFPATGGIKKQKLRDRAIAMVLLLVRMS
jgi:hypothetical protein